MSVTTNFTIFVQTNNNLFQKYYLQGQLEQIVNHNLSYSFQEGRLRFSQQPIIFQVVLSIQASYN